MRFERADQRAAARCVARPYQGLHLGVVARPGLCAALSNDRAVLNYDRANGRPRRNAAGCLSGQFDGSSQESQEWIGHCLHVIRWGWTKACSHKSVRITTPRLSFRT